MCKFKVGQKVKVRATYSLTSAIHNQVGIIRHIDNVSGDLAVEFDFEFVLGHDCRGHCTSGRGQWFRENSPYIELYHEPKFMLTDRIVYEGKKGTVVMVNEDLVHFILDEDVERTIVCSDNQLVKLNEIELKVGDIVKVVQTIPEKPSLFGKLGRVVQGEEDWFKLYAIEFFDAIDGWSCKEAPGSVNHCWGVKRECLEFQSRENKSEKGETKMEFNVGQKVIYTGNEYPKRKYSTCVILESNSDGTMLVKFMDGAILSVKEVKPLEIAKNINKIFSKKYTIDNVVGVYPNEEKRVVVVKFDDDYYNDYVRINCSDEDQFDVNIAVALAIAYQNAGSKNKFRKKVEAKTKVVKSKPKKEDKGDKAEFVTPVNAWKAFDYIFKETNDSFNKLFGKNIEASFGQRLKTARKAKGLTQTQLADLIGVVPSAVCHWEKDKALPEPRIRKLLEKELDL